ncbi:MAG: serine hydrolase [Coprobacillus sp.]
MKKFLSIFSVLLIVFISIQPLQATTEVPTLYSEYAYLYDPSTEVEYVNQKADERIYPASMTKVLTVSVSLEKIKDLSEKVTIIKQDFDGLAESGASVAQLNPGEKVTYKDLIYGALLPSGADACNILARTLFGSYQGMVDAMNEKVKELNLSNTHFMNVTGLHHDNHYTTVKEMAFILKDALKNKDFVEAFNTNEYQDSLKKRTWESTLGRARTLKQLDVTPLDGAKSGYTDQAQLTLASTMTVDNKQLILVTAKADGQRTQNHVRDALNLYQYINNNYHKVVVYKKDETIQNFWVLKSFQGIYALKAKEEVSLLVEKDINDDNINIKYHGNIIVNAPIQEQEELGKVIISHNDSTLCEYQINADHTIESQTIAFALHYILLITIPLLLVYKIIKKIKFKH